MKKVGKIIGNILITIVLIFSIIMTVAVISSTKNEARLPNLFGKAICNVLTDSMMSEEGFPEGSLIIVDLVTEEEAAKLKVGDVVTFYRNYENEVYLETHRIVADTYTTETENVIDGIWYRGIQTAITHFIHQALLIFKKLFRESATFVSKIRFPGFRINVRNRNYLDSWIVSVLTHDPSDDIMHGPSSCQMQFFAWFSVKVFNFSLSGIDRVFVPQAIQDPFIQRLLDSANHIVNQKEFTRTDLTCVI